MALPVTDQLITQMMTENVRTTPTTPMITGLMKESVKVPETPLKQERTKEPAVATGGPAQSAEEIDMAVEDMAPENVSVPTPMSDALANNTMAPLGTLTDQNTGLMSNTA